MVGLIKERVLERRFADPDRRIPVTLHGQPTYRVSEGEIRGLYQSYPEWGDILFKLQGGEAMTAAERVDLYRLVSGRKRFQTHMVQILANFLPLQTIRARITGGEPLIRELRALRGVTQGGTHRFDVYFHTLEVLDQLVDNVLPLDFVPDSVRRCVHSALDEEIGDVSRRDLLLLATALHDLGKISAERAETTSHAQRSLKAAQPILDALRSDRCPEGARQRRHRLPRASEATPTRGALGGVRRARRSRPPLHVPHGRIPEPLPHRDHPPLPRGHPRPAGRRDLLRSRWNAASR